MSQILTIYSPLQTTQRDLTVSLALYKNDLVSEIVEYQGEKTLNLKNSDNNVVMPLKFHGFY